MSGGAPLRLVRVIWEDASVVDDGTWATKDDLKPAEPVIFDQVGWLMEMTSEHIVLTEAVGEKLIAARNRIPFGMVKAVYEYEATRGTQINA